MTAIQKEELASPCILQINFEFSVASDQVQQQGIQLAESIAQVSGLHWKIWLMDEAAHRTGGIYLFESQAAAEAYLASDIGQAIQNNPAFTNFQICLTPVWQSPTAITASSVIPVQVLS